MKLGEALSRRADLERKIKALKEQIGQNLFKQEDQAAVLDPAVLIREAEQAASELADLIRRINRTNAQTEVEAGQTLSDLLTERDCEKAKRAIYLAGVPAQGQTLFRGLRSELRMLPALDAAECQAKADKAAKRFRDIDAVIQERNWTTDLL